MQAHRLLSGGTIFLMILLVVAGWFLVAQPQLAAASTANGQLATAQAKIASTQDAITQLKSQQKGLPKLQLQLAALRQSIPEGAESSAFIDGINALAASTGVTVNSLSMSDAVPYTPPVAPVTPSRTAGSATPSPSPSAAATAAPASAAPVAPSAWSPTSDPTITAANFVAIPVSITTVGDWNATLAFFHGLQSGPRLFLISGFKTASDATGVMTATISGYIYALLDPKADALRAATAKSSPTPTPTPTVTPSPTATLNPSGSATPTPTPSPTPTK